MPASNLSMRDIAVAHARNGFRVFKLIVNGKTPAIDDFPKLASNDPATVWAAWTDPVTGESLGNNIGILTGGDFFVVDVDVKDGKNGDETLDALIDQGLDTDTRTARSPTGSLHLYYELPDGRNARNTVQKLGKGVDTRGHHGFVVAPGSVTKDGTYEWLYEQDMLLAPDWILDQCERREQAATDASELGDVDIEANIVRAIRYLEQDAPQAIEGQGGDEQTLKVANRVMDFGISEAETLALMLAHWNEEKAVPPWQAEQLQRKVENAARYRQEPIGRSSASADFYAVDLDESPSVAPAGPAEPPQKRPKLFRRTFDEARQRALLTAANPLIKGFLDTHAFSVVYGESGVGKTFVSLDIAYHIAAGLPWNGRKTVSAPVLYVAAEAGEDINARLEALHRHYRPEREPPLDVVPCLVDLFNASADLKPLVDLARAGQADHGQPYALIVVDTLARSMGAGDENSTQDMNVMVRHFDVLRVATGAHVMVVHHSGKNKAAGARGSSALRAATDTEIEVADRVIETKKQRARAAGQKIRFDLRGIDIGQDGDGDRVSSCVVVLRTASEFEKVPLTSSEEEWFELLEAFVTDAANADKCRIGEFHFGYGHLERIFFQKANPSLAIPRQTMTTRMTGMTEKGWVKKVARGQWVIVE